MELGVVCDMAVGAQPDRVAVTGPDGTSLTVAELDAAARVAAGEFVRAGVRRVGYLGPSDSAFPVVLLGAALAGVPFCPFNYRLADAQLLPQVTAEPDSVIVAGPAEAERLASLGVDHVRPLADFGHTPTDAAGVRSHESADLPVVDDDAPAVLLFTSGTTAAPKAAILRHRHLTSYLLTAVEFASAAPDDAVLVSVPPYHIAGVSTVLSNLFAGRRIVYLDPFDAHRWLEVAAQERITNAMVVPTMLARIVDALDGHRAELPALRSLAYGGAPMPPHVVEAALAAFDGVDLINAYGLTETSSTITVLDGEDHRVAMASDDEAVRARLGSVGRAVPGIELAIRHEDGSPCGPGEVGEIFVRGAQVSGEYVGLGRTDDEGWFATRDRGHLDAAGYLFIEGRADDTIIRGGENIAPAEIEHVLLRHPGVADCAVVGVADAEWGHRIAAAVVPSAPGTADPDELRAWVRERLRTSKTPDVIVVRDALPYTHTGKLLRRALRTELEEDSAGG